MPDRHAKRFLSVDPVLVWCSQVELKKWTVVSSPFLLQVALRITKKLIWEESFTFIPSGYTVVYFPLRLSTESTSSGRKMNKIFLRIGTPQNNNFLLWTLDGALRNQASKIAVSGCWTMEQYLFTLLVVLVWSNCLLSSTPCTLPQIFVKTK